jgi:hypothetical protein
MREAQQTARRFFDRQRGRVCAVCFFLCVCAAAGAEENSVPRKIPILFSDHHADHALWLFEQGSGGTASLIVVDAHADTSPNAGRDAILRDLHAGYYRRADDLFANHNWIHPLVPSPVDSLVWISRISGFPGSEKYDGFIKSSAGWGLKRRRCITLDELDTVSRDNNTLFISVDLDFFYNADYTPRDIPFVFDKLLDFSLRWNGNLVWAVCVSRAWLPGIEYAWELLEQSLAWLASRTEFEVPVFTVFSGNRRDTSRNAESFRIMGMEPPGLYQKEDEMPDRLKQLLAELKSIQ